MGTRKKRTFFPDTNILGKNADMMFSLANKPGNKVILTDVNIEELHRGKKGTKGYNRNARLCLSNIVKLAGKRKDKGGLVKGYRTIEGGDIYLWSDYNADPEKELDKFYAKIDGGDLRLLCAAKQYKAKHPDEDVRIITTDKDVVIVAWENGIEATFKKGEEIDSRDLYKGYRIIKNDRLYAAMIGSAKYKDIRFDVGKCGDPSLENLVTNEYVIFADEGFYKRLMHEQGAKPKREQIFRYDMKDGLLVPIKYKYQSIIGYEPKNFEQVLAFDLLLDDDIKVKALVGEAGTGKTFLAQMIAIYKTVRMRAELERDRLGENKKLAQMKGLNEIYKQLPGILMTKRDVSVEKENYGAVKGNIIKKQFANYGGMENNYNEIATKCAEAFEFFQKHELPTTLMKLLNSQDSLITLQPLGSIRGKSLGYDSLIIEEGQNMEDRAMKGLITRMGGREVYITGDLTQIDNPNTFDYDGLTHVINAIQNTKEPRLASRLGTITLKWNERDPVSEWASRYL